MTPTELKQWRKAHHLTKKELANMLNVSWHTVESWECGKNPIGGPVKLAIAHLDSLARDAERKRRHRRRDRAATETPQPTRRPTKKLPSREEAHIALREAREVAEQADRRALSEEVREAHAAIRRAREQSEAVKNLEILLAGYRLPSESQ